MSLKLFMEDTKKYLEEHQNNTKLSKYLGDDYKSLPYTPEKNTIITLGFPVVNALSEICLQTYLELKSDDTVITLEEYRNSFVCKVTKTPLVEKLYLGGVANYFVLESDIEHLTALTVDLGCLINKIFEQFKVLHNGDTLKKVILDAELNMLTRKLLKHEKYLINQLDTTKVEN